MMRKMMNSIFNYEAMEKNDQRTRRIFRKLASQSKTTINRLRKEYFGFLIQEYTALGRLENSELIKQAKSEANNATKKDLIDFWEVMTECDFSIIPKNQFKILSKSDKQFMEYLNEN